MSGGLARWYRAQIKAAVLKVKDSSIRVLANTVGVCTQNPSVSDSGIYQQLRCNLRYQAFKDNLQRMLGIDSDLDTFFPSFVARTSCRDQVCHRHHLQSQLAFLINVHYAEIATLAQVIQT